jgi:general secretion pathway protein E
MKSISIRKKKNCHQAQALNLPFWREMPTEIAGVGFNGQVPVQFLKRHKIVPRKHIPPRLSRSTILLSRTHRRPEATAAESGYLHRSRSRIRHPFAIKQLYEHDRSTVEAFVQTFMMTPMTGFFQKSKTGDILDDAHEAPMIQLVNLILSGRSGTGQ